MEVLLRMLKYVDCPTSSYELFLWCNDHYVGQLRHFKIWMSGLSFAYRVFAYLIMNTNMLSILISWQLILIRAVLTPWHHCLSVMGESHSKTDTASHVNERSFKTNCTSLPFTWLDIFPIFLRSQKIPSSWKSNDWFHSLVVIFLFSIKRECREAKSRCEVSPDISPKQRF